VPAAVITGTQAATGEVYAMAVSVESAAYSKKKDREARACLRSVWLRDRRCERAAGVPDVPFNGLGAGAARVGELTSGVLATCRPVFASA